MWEVYAIKYADRPGRTRADSFMFDEHHDIAHDMDYFIWVLRKGEEVILVDTGYDAEEAQRRGRPIRMSPIEALAPLGIDPSQVQTIICTHLHYDHAGGLHLFPNATVHLQVAEMAYATGPCMCHGVLRAPFSKQHIAVAVDRLFSDKLVYHDGDEEVAEGVSVHCVGGHSRGLQVVRVQTQAGWMTLASDASHYYENFTDNKIFPIVVDLENMLSGFKRIQQLASHPKLVVPGHDPLVMSYYSEYKAAFVRRLDQGPNKNCPL